MAAGGDKADRDGAVDLLSLIVEFLFLLVFLGAVREYARRRDPVTRDVAVVFSPFVFLLASSLWRQLIGPSPALLGLASVVFLLAQPVMVLRVVCDLIMPEVDGFEVISRMKDDLRTADIPIIVCTAHELTDADRDRLNGKIMGIVSKGNDARDGLREWLHRVAPVVGRADIDEAEDATA
jgi:CheY-like chemotaxis protein